MQRANVSPSGAFRIIGPGACASGKINVKSHEIKTPKRWLGRIVASRFVALKSIEKPFLPNPVKH